MCVPGCCGCGNKRGAAKDFTTLQRSACQNHKLVHFIDGRNIYTNKNVKTSVASRCVQCALLGENAE